METSEHLSKQLNEQKLKVDYNSYDFSVKELISLVEENTINISPDYQRQFRWEDERQSSLIESIFLGIPVPPLYMATNPDGTWEVIDGVQRLSSIINFVSDIDSQARKKIGKNNVLKIKGLLKLSKLNEMEFSKLPISLRLDFQLKPLKVITLSDKSDFSVRFDLFQRLNTGGLKLSDQEIRSCVYKGEFNDFIRRMTHLKDFKSLVKLQKGKESNGSTEELVLRFFAYLNNREKFDHSVVDFLNSYMLDSTKKFNYEQNESLFKKTFSKLSQLEKGIVKSRTRNITSFIFFEAITVGAAEALKIKEDIKIDDFYEWITNNTFNDLITGATNTKSRVLDRIDYCKNMFLR